MMQMSPDYDFEQYNTREGRGGVPPRDYNWYKDVTPAQEEPPAVADIMPEDSGYAGEDITGDITLPESWTTANEYLKGLLSGTYSIGGGGSGAWGSARARAEQMLGTGEPVDISGWWQAQKPIYAQGYEDQARQLAEEAGLGGLRWSSGLQRNIADMVKRGETELMGQAMERQLSADEAAKARILQTMGILGQIGGGESSAGMAGAAQRLSAINALMGSGQAEAQFGLDLTKQLAGMGTGQFGMEQTGYEDVYNPAWMSAALGLSGQGATGIPTSYQPSIWEQLAGASSYIPGIVGAFKKPEETGGGWA